MRTLKNCKPGQSARVLRVQGADALRIRIMEMGLTPGTVLRVLKLAPLGDPMEIIVRGYALSLRKSDAARIEIE